MAAEDSDIQVLMNEYRTLKDREGVKQLELVTLEYKIWDLMKRTHGTGITKNQDIGVRRDWFVRQFGGPPSMYEYRFTIFNAGVWAHGLFDLVDQRSMQLSEAKEVIAKVRRTVAQKKTSPTVVLNEILNGGEVQTETTDTDLVPVYISGKFRQQVSLLVEKHVEELMIGVAVEDYHRETLIADFRDSLDLLIRELGRKITRVKSETKRSAKRSVGALRFNWACEVLGLNYQFDKSEVDMRLVKKRKNERALALHPDRTKNDPKSTKELDRVMEAYELLEAYTAGKNRSAHGNKNV